MKNGSLSFWGLLEILHNNISKKELVILVMDEVLFNPQGGLNNKIFSIVYYLKDSGHEVIFGSKNPKKSLEKFKNNNLFWGITNELPKKIDIIFESITSNNDNLKPEKFKVLFCQDRFKIFFNE